MIVEVDRQKTNSISLLLVCLFLLKAFFFFFLNRICCMTMKSKNNGNLSVDERVR